MKKSFFLKSIIASLLMLFIVTPEVMSESVSVNSVAGYWIGDGGEFTLTPSAGLQWVLGLYDTKTKNIGNYDPSFQSFCVERRETVNANGGHYTAVLNDRARRGGAASGNDPISVGTAWLYHEFQLGKLTGYDYTPGNPNPNIDDHREISAGYLQNMIWFLEDEEGLVNNNPFEAVLLNKFGNNWANDAKADNNGQYPVAVLNLFDSNGHFRQDLLVCVPEPATMFLLGSGLIGLAGFARRRFKK